MKSYTASGSNPMLNELIKYYLGLTKAATGLNPSLLEVILNVLNNKKGATVLLLYELGVTN